MADVGCVDLRGLCGLRSEPRGMNQLGDILAMLCLYANVLFMRVEYTPQSSLTWRCLC
jgi:hypothetical protein